MYDIAIRALLIGGTLSLVAGPLGCLIIWRRMAFFSDTVAHSSLLGVAIALAFDVSPMIGVLSVALAVAYATTMTGEKYLGSDTMLAVTSHSFLAFGLLAISMMSVGSTDVMTYLVGDVLSVTWRNVFELLAVSIAALAVLIWRWQGLLIASLSRDLAVAAGINVRREEFWFVVITALVVAVSIQALGALLTAAILIVPASAALRVSASPEATAAWASAIGCISVASGLAVSWHLDTPTGPTFVAASIVIFVGVLVGKEIFERMRSRQK